MASSSKKAAPLPLLGNLFNFFGEPGQVRYSMQSTTAISRFNGLHDAALKEGTFVANIFKFSSNKNLRYSFSAINPYIFLKKSQFFQIYAHEYLTFPSPQSPLISFPQSVTFFGASVCCLLSKGSLHCLLFGKILTPPLCMAAMINLSGKQIQSILIFSPFRTIEFTLKKSETLKRAFITIIPLNQHKAP